MSDTIQPGQWVRYVPVSREDAAPKWRQLTDIGASGFTFMVTLFFADGFMTPWHRDSLALTDERGTPIWDVSDSKQEEAS